MDANGTRFHLLLGRDDWESCAFDGVDSTASSAWWDTASRAVRLPQKQFRFPKTPGNVSVKLASRRGAAIDAYGNWYFVGDDFDRLRVRSSGSGTLSDFWVIGDAIRHDPRSVPAGDFQPIEPPSAVTGRLGGLTVTASHYLVVGCLNRPGLLAFDLHAGGPPLRQRWFDGFAPFDMCAAPDGGVWMLERAGAARPGRLWRLDRRLGIIPLAGQPSVADQLAPGFGPVDGTNSGATAPDCAVVGAAPDPAFAFRLDGMVNPIAVECLHDGTVLILDREATTSKVWRYSQLSGLNGPFALEARRELIGTGSENTNLIPFDLLAQDFTFAPQPADPELPVTALPGRLFIVDREGNQAYAFSVTIGEGSVPAFELLPEYWPMRLFGGRAIVAGSKGAWFDSGPRPHLTALVQQSRPAYVSELTFRTPLRTNGTSDETRPAFDGREPNCVWHRVLIDGCFPPTTTIAVRSRAANSELELATAAWHSEPSPYPRREGSELPFTRQMRRAHWGTRELLLQNARGRYLQLEITLTGDGRTSPKLRALRAYYPRFSYIDHYLPAVYRADPVSSSFLDRFLANIEGVQTSIEDRIAAVRMLFSAREAPSEYLDWLAGWFGTALDPHWDERRRRLFVAYAPQLFAERGTIPGMIRAIRLATDPWPDESIFSTDPDELLGAGRAAAIRIVEQFVRRPASRLPHGDTSPTSLGVAVESARWTPDQGAHRLETLFRDFLQERGATETQIAFPPVRPASPAMASMWELFLRDRVGFTYAPVSLSDVGAWRSFLARRYVSIGAWKRAYGMDGEPQPADFSAITLPTTLPDDGVPLADWIQFVSLVIPAARNAHRFSVLVPVDTSVDSIEFGSMSDRVRKIVELEKPAHTVFDIREYWALFRVGEARLGYETLIDKGSRFDPILLGQAALAAGYLDFPHPWNVPDRWVLPGSEPVTAQRAPRTGAFTAASIPREVGHV